MSGDRNITTGGGTYVEGNVTVHTYDNHVNNTHVTVYVLPDAEADVLRAYTDGADLKQVAVVRAPDPNTHKLTPANDAPEGARDGRDDGLPFDLGPHWIVRKPSVFEDQQWFVMGSTLLIPTIAGRQTRLRTFGGSAFYEFDVRLTPDGQLEASIWESSEFVRVASSPNEQTFTTTSAAHRWHFQQYDPTQVLPVGGSQSSVVSFDPGLVQTIWRIRHERETKRPQTFLLVLKQATPQQVSS